MGFCNFSQELVNVGYTTVDNLFITNYLPEAPNKYVDIYLFGLYLCSKCGQDNNLDTMARVLGIDKEDILTAYTYWQELGLVHILQKNPCEVVYMPVRSDDVLLKKIKPQKYQQFNKDIQGVLCERMISTNEYNEYYIFLETTFFEPKALVAVAKYCAEKKGNDINYPYILKVARSLSDSGIKTVDAVEQKLSTTVKYTDDIKLLFGALGTKRSIEYDDRRLFEKWTEGMGYDLETLRFVAKKYKKASMEYLDRRIDAYYKMGLHSMADIAGYDKNRDKMFEIAKQINKIIGVYYQSLDFIIEDYITPWLNKGFDESSLTLVAKYCFKQNVRTIDGMDGVVQKFYQKGLTSQNAIAQYMTDLVSQDKQVKDVLQTAGLLRGVAQSDRNSYKTWTESWGMPHDLVLHVATLSNGATNQMAYINKVLADFKANGIDSVQKAQQHKQTQKPKTQAKYKQREYTDEEFDALFEDLKNVEL